MKWMRRAPASAQRIILLLIVLRPPKLKFAFVPWVYGAEFAFVRRYDGLSSWQKFFVSQPQLAIAEKPTQEYVE
jgi:hypothetical protein